MSGNFEHSSRLVRLILRRERVLSTVWIVLLVLFSVGLAPALANMFDDAARAAYLATVNNPGMIAIMGPVYGASNYTAGAMYAGDMLLWVIIAVAVMNIFLVVRHTRGDEEKGRIEVVRSLPTGRLANLNATMIMAVIVNGALALLTGLGLAAMNVATMGFNGSMLYGVMLGVTGLVFAAITAVFAQLSASSRGAITLSFVALVVIYMLRAVGDMSSEALALISPMGLALRSQVYVSNYWWPALVLLLEFVAITAVAYALNARRDMDQGFIHAKPGRSEASKLLRSSFGLSYRLTRNMVIAWAAGIFILAASYGSILGTIDDFIKNSDFYSQIIGANPNFSTAQMYVTMVISIMSLVALVPALSAALKMRGEEKDGRAEHVLSRVVSRDKYLSGFVIMAFAASILTQLADAVGLYAAAASVLTNPGDLTLGYLLKANLVYVPAIWVMIGVAVLLIGLLPKATSGITWGYFGFTFVAVFIGRMPNLLPAWFAKLTPYGYVPQLPVDSVNYGTLAVLAVIAAALTAAGFVLYRRRDMVA